MSHRTYGIYEAYNEKDELVARGTNADVAMVLGCNKDWINTYARNGTRVKGKFRIEKMGYEKRTLHIQYDRIVRKEKRPKPVPISPEDEILNNQIWNLEHNGNTTVNSNPEKYLKIFNEKGIDCWYEKVQYTTVKGRKEKPHYIFHKHEKQRKV